MTLIAEMIETKIVVGEVFKNAVDSEKIFSYSQIMQMLQKYTIKKGTLLIGQGISENSVTSMKNLIEKLNLKKDISIISYFDKFQRCQNKLTHKTKSFNILISEPMHHIDDVYQCVLMIDDRCADLSDHVTGQHLQGMLLMEAARQMTIATLEKYFIQNNKNKSVKLVMQEFQSKFYHYAFPLDVMLCLKIINNEGIDDSNRTFTITISIYQNGKKIADIFRKVASYDAQFIKYKEAIALQDCIISCLKNNLHLNYTGSAQLYEKAS